MANRSYIYAMAGEKILSLGECGYNIPVAYKILAAYDNEVCDSYIYGNPKAIKGDFRQGRAGLYALLDHLVATNAMDEPDRFKEQVVATKAFLDGIPGERTLLENGEIVALYQDEDGTPITVEGMARVNEYDREDYTWLGQDIDGLAELGVPPEHFFQVKVESFLKIYKWVFDLRATWQKELGLDTWRTVLFHQFD